MFTLMRKILKDESGQGMVEYGLVMGSVSVTLIAALTALGEEVRAVFEEISTMIP